MLETEKNVHLICLQGKGSPKIHHCNNKVSSTVHYICTFFFSICLHHCFSSIAYKKNSQI